MNRLILPLATGFGLGCVPLLPGSVGTLLAIPLYFGLMGLSPLTYFVTLLTFILISIWVSDLANTYFGGYDSKKIVIDEVAGFLVTLSFHPFTWTTLILGFILFRFFDISKWCWVGTVERKFSGGVGIVLDDVLAGIWASLVLFGIEKFII